MKDNIVTPTELLERLNGLTSLEESKGALLFINLYGLKRMGTIIGARNTETIISTLIQQFEKGVRPNDSILRTGRFEFVVLTPKILNQGHAILAANKIAGILSLPIRISGQDRMHAFSIGITLTPEHTTDPEQLFRYAELASIAAKRTQQPYQLYSPDEMRHVVTDWDIEGDLERAIANGELCLHYQPKISAHTSEVLGAEALMRWNHPSHGAVPPSKFIPVAEKIGIMPKLTWWCLNTALRERILWDDTAKNLSIAVNISALDLVDNGFAKAVTNSLGIWNTRPESLILEITEGSFMQDISLSANILNQLHNFGIRISIDDFGTGYSSLSYFQRLPANELKIDRSFIFNIQNDELNQHIVSTIIQMAKRLNLNVVAEGIESGEMQQVLTELGCDTMQGYHIARPMPLESFIAWLAEH